MMCCWHEKRLKFAIRDERKKFLTFFPIFSTQFFPKWFNFISYMMRHLCLSSFPSITLASVHKSSTKNEFSIMICDEAGEETLKLCSLLTDSSATCVSIARRLNYSNQTLVVVRSQSHEWHRRKQLIEPFSLLRFIQFFNTLSLFHFLSFWLIYLRNWKKELLALYIEEENMFAVNELKKGKVSRTFSFTIAKNISFISFDKTFNLFSAN